MLQLIKKTVCDVKRRKKGQNIFKHIALLLYTESSVTAFYKAKH